MLAQAERAAPAQVRLRRVFGEVCDIARTEGPRPFAVRFPDRPPILADRVILALGNPSAPWPSWADEVRDHPAYRHDPWTLPRTLGAHHSVLIVGNGLTMADVALTLSQDTSQVPLLHTISRRGLVSQPQTTFRPSAVQSGSDVLLACAHSIRRVLAASRDLAREIESAGGDWREVVTFIRNLAPGLWQRLPEAEQRRFVRHLQAYWDVHRHRLPPQLGERVTYLRGSGRLRVNAGRIQRVIPREDRLQVSWQPRGGGETQVLTVDLIVNATGPNYTLARSTDPLTNALRAAGLVSEDALDLGLRTSRYGACVDARGRANGHLFYLGPMLRAGHWEATAATELRNHAEQLAAHLAGRDD